MSHVTVRVPAGACQVHTTADAIDPVDIDPPPDYADESLGTKEKFWFTGPDNQLWLFKYARFKGRDNGTDWAELTAHAVATDFQIPSACVALGTCDGHRGVLVRSVVAEDEGLVHGNEILAAREPEYDRALTRQNPLYTVAAVRSALEGIESHDGQTSAFAQFTSYLMLDALMAGRDRHHENWAVIRGPSSTRLAPSFDHGNAFAFAEPSDRAAQLATNPERLSKWVQRGKSHHFAGRPSLVQLAVDALALCDPEDRHNLTVTLETAQLDTFESTLARIPERVMSEGHRTLSVEIIKANRGRLLDAITS